MDECPSPKMKRIRLTLDKYSVDSSYFFCSFEMELPCGAAVVVGVGVVVVIIPTSPWSDDSYPDSESAPVTNSLPLLIAFPAQLSLPRRLALGIVLCEAGPFIFYFFLFFFPGRLRNPGQASRGFDPPNSI